MLLITLAANDEPAEQILGCIGCESIAPVTDYQLVTAGNNGEAAVTTLADYSRWTEPAYALLARLLRAHPWTTATATSGVSLHSSIYLGKSVASGRLIERLEARIVDGNLHASLRDEFGENDANGPVRSAYPHAFDMLEHAARLAAWQADVEPPIPPPLTDVPIRHDRGPPHVLAADIPAFPRRHFEERHNGCKVPMTGAYYARDWWFFIGGRS